MAGDCMTCENMSCLIKHSISNEKVQQFSVKKRVMKVAKNRNFVTEGTTVQGLFFVYDGIVNVYKTGINGKEQILRFSQDGDVIGFRGYATHPEYQIGALTLKETTLCFFSNEILEDTFLSIPELTLDFMKFYAEELDRSETKVRKFSHMTVREKVIDTLLYLNRKFGQLNGYLSLQLSRKEIAGFAGTTDEQVTRVITALEKEGLLIKRVKKVGIPDVEKLKNEISDHNFFLSS